MKKAMQNDSQADYRQQKLIGGQMLHRISKKKTLLSPIHRSIGALTFTINGFESKGSAILISKNLILTAAHNIYTKEFGQHSNFKFYLAPCGVIEVDRYYEIQSWRYCKQFESCPANKKSQYDYAIMKLKQSIQTPIKYESFCELALTCPKCKIEDENQMELAIYGYPFQQPNYVPIDTKGKKISLFQYGLSREGKVDSVDYDLGAIKYIISTLPGQSGCPVINEVNIIGIHLGSKINNAYNIGRLITFDVIQNLKAWAKQLKAYQFLVNPNSICTHYNYKIIEQSKNEIKKDPKPSLVKCNSISTHNNQKIIEQPKDELKKDPKPITKFSGYLSYKQISKPTEVPKEIFNSPNKNSKKNQSRQQLLEKGKQFHQKKRYPQAHDSFSQCLKLTKQEHGQKGIKCTQVINCIGGVYLAQREYYKSIDCYKDSAKIFQLNNIKDKDYAMTLANIGLAYRCLKNYKMSIQFYQKAIQIYENTDLFDKTRQCGKNLAYCWNQVGDKDKVKYLMQDHNLSEKDIQQLD